MFISSLKLPEKCSNVFVCLFEISPPQLATFQQLSLVIKREGLAAAIRQFPPPPEVTERKEEKKTWPVLLLWRHDDMKPGCWLIFGRWIFLKLYYVYFTATSTTLPPRRDSAVSGICTYQLATYRPPSIPPQPHAVQNLSQGQIKLPVRTRKSKVPSFGSLNESVGEYIRKNGIQEQRIV